MKLDDEILSIHKCNINISMIKDKHCGISVCPFSMNNHYM